MSPAVSVCIANYNGIDLIDACIDSVRAQDFGLPVEIIVHDDASTDGSVEHIRARHPDVHLIESSENVGFCIANNRMAAAARGEYLLLLNNDATLLPDALSVFMGEAKRLASPAILTLPQYDAETGELLDIGSRLDPFLNPVPNLDPKRNDVGTVAGACLWIDKALWEELGGFPTGSAPSGRTYTCAAEPGWPVIRYARRATQATVTASGRASAAAKRARQVGHDFPAARTLGTQQDLRNGADLSRAVHAVAAAAASFPAAGRGCAAVAASG